MKSTDALPNDKILIIAAEASSCMYAKNLMKMWWQRHPNTEFFGVGDRGMAALGMDCQGYAEDMAVVGLQEVLKHYHPIKQVADAILKKSKSEKPRFALLLDYPGFNLRIAKKLKQMQIPVIYYISPQLWAWKKGRVKQVRKFVDEMLVVFPFEVDFYREHGIEAHFVGHPLVEVIEQELATATGSHNQPPVLGLMPGSRKSEIQYNLKNQLEAARLLQQKGDLQVRVLLAPTLQNSDITSQLAPYKSSVEVVQTAPTQMIQGCDFILSASGTATLQVALCEKPMVVMYRMHPLTAFFAKRLVNTVDSFCIVNLIAGEKIVQELFQEQADPQSLAAAVEVLWKSKAQREKQVEQLRKVKTQLGDGFATENVVQFLEKKFL
jgi:lipid-A-disaccharide synthase